jgi:hypothetical protein
MTWSESVIDILVPALVVLLIFVLAWLPYRRLNDRARSVFRSFCIKILIYGGVVIPIMVLLGVTFPTTPVTDCQNCGETVFMPSYVDGEEPLTVCQVCGHSFDPDYFDIDWYPNDHIDRLNFLWIPVLVFFVFPSTRGTNDRLDPTMVWCILSVLSGLILVLYGIDAMFKLEWVTDSWGDHYPHVYHNDLFPAVLLEKNQPIPLGWILGILLWAFVFMTSLYSPPWVKAAAVIASVMLLAIYSSTVYTPSSFTTSTGFTVHGGSPVELFAQSLIPIGVFVLVAQVLGIIVRTTFFRSTQTLP